MWIFNKKSVIAYSPSTEDIRVYEEENRNKERIQRYRLRRGVYHRMVLSTALQKPKGTGPLS